MAIIRTISTFVAIYFYLLLTPTARSFNALPKPAGLSKKKLIKLARKRFQKGEDDDKPMDGRVVVITGAAGGIGSELCQTLYSLGSTVIALDRNINGLMDLKKSLQITDDKRLLTFTTHHEDLASVSAMADQIKTSFPNIDVLINNAGLAYSQDLIPGSPGMVSAHGKDLAFTVNYLSHVLLTEKFLDNLSNTNGRIVHLTSTFHYKVDGKELLPPLDGSDPIALRAEPEEQGPKHVARSYANTKLAQIWHSRSIQAPNCKSVCACPTWAATGIAGEEGRDFLGNYGFPIANCGPGITSALNAILRTDDELGDALDNGTSFVANSRIVEYIWGLNVWLVNSFGLRDILTDALAIIILIGQRYTHDEFIIQQTSPESYNDEDKRKKFYQWSLKEIQPWL